jgi:hypothetical protein
MLQEHVGKVERSWLDGERSITPLRMQPMACEQVIANGRQCCRHGGATDSISRAICLIAKGRLMACKLPYFVLEVEATTQGAIGGAP